MKRIIIVFSLVMILVFILGCNSTITVTSTSFEPTTLVITQTQTQTTTTTQTQTTTATQTQTINITQTQTTTVTNTPTHRPNIWDVSSVTTLSKTSLIIGENLTIQSEIGYSGGDSYLSGLLCIYVTNSKNEMSLICFFDKENNILNSFSASKCFQIEKGIKYIASATWDLKNYVTHQYVNPGEYTIIVAIVYPYGNSYSWSPSLGVTITIS
jgi:hypothetical protein